MSAAAVASPAPAGPASAFSPIALFECTITNAQMLVESMELVDLILAQKIVCQLHGRLVEVMEPSAGRLAQQLAEMHSQCQSLHSASTASTSAATTSAAAALAASPNCEPGPPLQARVVAVKLEASALAYGDRDADDDIDNYSYGAYEGDGGEHVVSTDDASGDVGMLDLEIAGASASSAAASAAPQSGRSASGGGGLLSDKWKQLLRESYRLMKYQRGELFDFTKSYSAPVNLKAADSIIQKAIALSGTPPSQDVQSLKAALPVETFMRYWFKDILRRNYRRQHQPRDGRHCHAAKQKLSRRQRSYDNLLARGSLSALEKAKMAALLDRRYTSSDEEDPTAADDAESGTGVRPLRVRRLAWESAEAARLKAQLDRHFADTIANPRERQEVARLRRRHGGGVGGGDDDDNCVSDRPRPDNPLDWAVASAECGDAAAAAAPASLLG